MRSIAILLRVFSFVAVLTVAVAARDFRCSGNAMCEVLIDYVSANSTTLADVKTLFGVKNLRSLLGANGMPLSTSPNETVPAQQPIKIPFPCICSNGTGISKNRPVYKVKEGGDLDTIATKMFSGLVTYQQIAKVNNIPDPTKIDKGQELWIPLPCSCDAVNGSQVVHYGHLVAPGSSLELIAGRYGTTEETLLTLNGIDDPKKLQAGDVIDVPLKACTSEVRNTSIDYPLLISNDTYTFTANNCVQCKCDSANNWILQCEPSQGVKVSNWSVCPSMTCEGARDLYLGNVTTSTACQRTACAYAGYNKQFIFTAIANESTCAGGSPESQPPGNFAPSIDLRETNWRLLLMSLNLGVLCFGSLW